MNEYAPNDIAHATQRARMLRARAVSELLAHAWAGVRALTEKWLERRQSRIRSYLAVSHCDEILVDKKILQDCRHTL